MNSPFRNHVATIACCNFRIIGPLCVCCAFHLEMPEEPGANNVRRPLFGPNHALRREKLGPELLIHPNNYTWIIKPILAGQQTQGLKIRLYINYEANYVAILKHEMA